MKVYLAGRYDDEKIPSYIEILEKEGFIVTHDWTKHKGDIPEMASVNDFKGVHNCSYLIAIMDSTTYPYRGTFTEIGYGLALNKHVIIVNPNENDSCYCESNCFYYHPKITHLNTLDEAMNDIIEIELKLITEKEQHIKRYNRKKYLIIGSARHGKDSFSDLVYKLKGKKSISSSQIANELFIFNELKGKYNYNNEEECFNDRINHRQEWYELICNYNKDDKSRLTNEIFKKYDIYIGLRDRNEFLQSRHLFDLVIMIDASERVHEKDSTFLLNKNDADIIITNNESIENFNTKCEKIINMIF
jgi:nucleoside 2-deoxyribosyltransferase